METVVGWGRKVLASAEDTGNKLLKWWRKTEQKLKNEMDEAERIKMEKNLEGISSREDFPVNILCTGKTKKLKHHFYKTVENLVNPDENQPLYRTEWIQEDEKYSCPCIIVFYSQKMKDKANVKNEHSNLTSTIEEKTSDKPIIMVIYGDANEHTENFSDDLKTDKCHPVIITISMKDFEPVNDDSYKETISELRKYMEKIKESNQAKTITTQGPVQVENEDQELSNISEHKKLEENPEIVNQETVENEDQELSKNSEHKAQEDNPDIVNQELVTKHIEVCCCSMPALPRKAFSSFLERHLPGYLPEWFEPGEKLKGNSPCLVVCFTLSRIEDDGNGVVKELHLPSGCKAMLIVIQNCAQGLAPGSMLTTYGNEKIDCFTNILYDNGICYSCAINSKAQKLIDQFVNIKK